MARFLLKNVSHLAHTTERGRSAHLYKLLSMQTQLYTPGHRRKLIVVSKNKTFVLTFGSPKSGDQSGDQSEASTARGTDPAFCQDSHPSGPIRRRTRRLWPISIRTAGAKGRLSKSWNQRLPIEAGKRETGLGAYPAVQLHSARQKALDNWQRVKAGEDILATLAAPIPTPTVSEMFDVVIATRRQGWRTKTTETAWRRYQRKCKSILANQSRK